MTVGRTLGAYVSDRLVDPAVPGTYKEFVMSVPNDYYAQAPRGWTAAVAGTDRLPKLCTPRHVEGVDPATGRRYKAIIATVGADLWTGVATTFPIERMGSATPV